MRHKSGHAKGIHRYQLICNQAHTAIGRGWVNPQQRDRQQRLFPLFNTRAHQI